MRTVHGRILSRRAVAIAALAFDASFVNARLTKGRVGLEVNATPTAVGDRLVSGLVIAGLNNAAWAVLALSARRVLRRPPEGRRRFDAPTLVLAALFVPAVPIAYMTTYGMCEKIFQR